MLIDDPLWLNGPKWLCDVNPIQKIVGCHQKTQCMLEMRNKGAIAVQEITHFVINYWL